MAKEVNMIAVQWQKGPDGKPYVGPVEIKPKSQSAPKLIAKLDPSPWDQPDKPVQVPKPRPGPAPVPYAELEVVFGFEPKKEGGEELVARLFDEKSGITTLYKLSASAVRSGSSPGNYERWLVAVPPRPFFEEPGGKLRIFAVTPLRYIRKEVPEHERRRRVTTIESPPEPPSETGQTREGRFVLRDVKVGVDPKTRQPIFEKRIQTARLDNIYGLVVYDPIFGPMPEHGETWRFEVGARTFYRPEDTERKKVAFTAYMVTILDRLEHMPKGKKPEDFVPQTSEMLVGARVSAPKGAELSATPSQTNGAKPPKGALGVPVERIGMVPVHSATGNIIPDEVRHMMGAPSPKRGMAVRQEKKKGKSKKGGKK